MRLSVGIEHLLQPSPRSHSSNCRFWPFALLCYFSNLGFAACSLCRKVEWHWENKSSAMANVLSCNFYCWKIKNSTSAAKFDGSCCCLCSTSCVFPFIALSSWHTNGQMALKLTTAGAEKSGFHEEYFAMLWPWKHEYMTFSLLMFSTFVCFDFFQFCCTTLILFYKNPNQLQL